MSKYQPPTLKYGHNVLPKLTVKWAVQIGKTHAQKHFKNFYHPIKLMVKQFCFDVLSQIIGSYITSKTFVEPETATVIHTFLQKCRHAAVMQNMDDQLRHAVV